MDRRHQNVAPAVVRRHKLVKMAAFGLCVYFTASIITCRIELFKENRVLEDIRNKIEIQQLENDELERIINSEDNDEYIERIAREKLGYAGVDERVFVDLAGS